MSVLSLTAGASPAALLFNGQTITKGSLGSYFDSDDSSEIIITDDVDRSRYPAAHVMSQLESWLYAALGAGMPEKAAFIVSIPSGCYIGSFQKNAIELFKVFSYPNSLELFIASAMRFTGKGNLDDFLQDSLSGKNSYEETISNYILTSNQNSYNLLIDLTRGMGRGPANADMCASAQSVYEKIINNLSIWLTSTIDTTNLIISGTIVDNAKLITYLSSKYHLYIPPTSHASIRALGGLVKYHKAYISTLELGKSRGRDSDPDSLANQLLANPTTPISHAYGKLIFGNKSLARDAKFLIPFAPLTTKYTGLPLYVCQRSDYSLYFEGNSKDRWAQYLHTTKVPGLKTGRVLITDFTDHYFLNRVITVTRQQGYPILQAVDNEI